MTVADTDDDDLESAIVRINAGFVSSEDVLAATDWDGLSQSYDTNTGTLTIYWSNA